MAGKQMEGDNQRRRALARRARARGLAASELRVTLGASKQPRHIEHTHRDGPQNRDTDRVEPSPAPPERRWPRYDPSAVGIDPAPVDAELGIVRYRAFVQEIARRSGLDFDQAHVSAEATVVALADGLRPAQGVAFLESLPRELYDEHPVRFSSYELTLGNLLDEVGRIAQVSAERARLRAQAVLSVLATSIGGPPLPPDVVELTQPPPVGGGVTGATGETAPLTHEEVQAALARLPRWTGDQRALVRMIELPPENLERVLQRLEVLKREIGRGPHIGRQNERTAGLIVRTQRVDAVTALDVELAHRLDAAIDEASAGMSA